MGAVTGVVTQQDGLAPGASVVLIDIDGQIAATALIDEHGNYLVDEMPVGIYRLFARRADGGASVELGTTVEVLEGITRTAVDLAFDESAEEPSPVEIQLAAQVDVTQTLETDGNGYVVVPIGLSAVEDLTGFVVQLTFDPQQVALVEILPDQDATSNVLYHNGGAPLFLPRS